VLDEDEGKIGSSWASNLQIRVEHYMPTEASWMKSPDESVHAVYDQECTMIRGIATRVQHMPGSTERPGSQQMHSSRT
jgi:hypothetical protein